LSAGSICWFRHGNSDAPLSEGSRHLKTMRIDGLDLAPIALCPHTKEESFRLADFRAMMRQTPGPGIGLDDRCAIHVRGDHFRIVSAVQGACAHLIVWREGTLHERELMPSSEYLSWGDLA
jgi:dipeptidase E